MKVKKISRFMVMVVVILLYTYSSVVANIRQHTEAFYVNDFARVLSPETMTHIVERNLVLNEISGAQIVVTTVHFTDGMTMYDYANAMFNEWGIGDSERNNGILLLLVIGQEDYFIATGDGIHEIITDGELGGILYRHLEPYFYDSNYDAGVLNAFNEIYNVISRHYDPVLSISPTTPSTLSSNYELNQVTATQTSGFNPNNLLAILVFIAFIMFAPRMSTGRRLSRRSVRRHGGSFLWGIPMFPNTRRSNNSRVTPFARPRHDPNSTAFGNPPAPKYKGHSTAFKESGNGGGGRSSGGIGRGASQSGGVGIGKKSGGFSGSSIGKGSDRTGGGGRSSGGGVGRRR